MELDHPQPLSLPFRPFRPLRIARQRRIRRSEGQTDEPLRDPQRRGPVGFPHYQGNILVVFFFLFLFFLFFLFVLFFLFLLLSLIFLSLITRPICCSPFTFSSLSLAVQSSPCFSRSSSCPCFSLLSCLILLRNRQNGRIRK